MDSETLKWQVGQRFVTGFPGLEMDGEFKELVRRWKIGNIILFSRNLSGKDQIANLCGEIAALVLKETGTIPWIMIDQEGGMVSRLPSDCAVAPSQMALAALGDTKAVYRSALLTAKELKALGCNVNLAPVLDVNSNPKNPVIGIRSFSSDAKEVARFAQYAISGFMDGGVLCCGKHFPGHGDTTVDSHLSLPKVDKSKEELQDQLYPFKEAIRDGIPSIMSSHVLFPAYEKGNYPCTMSRSIITGLLREGLGFKGLVFSDCMEMQAIASYYGTENGCSYALHAGIDQVLVSHHADIAAKAMEKVICEFQDGLFDQKEWDASLARIALWKKKIADTPASSVPENAKAELNGYAARSITLVSGTIPPLPVNPLWIAPEAFITSNIQDKIAIADYAHYLASHLGGDALVISANPDETEIRNVVEKAKGRQVYLGTYNGHLQRGQIRLAEALVKEGVSLVVTALRNPFDLSTLKGKATCIAAWEYSMRIFDALENVYRGQMVLGTRMPVELE